VAIFIGHLIWTNGDVYFLFIASGWPLITMVLAFLTIVWFTTVIILLAQTLGKDLLEQLGKLKVSDIDLILSTKYFFRSLSFMLYARFSFVPLPLPNRST
jgi:hypothetical protein